MIALKAQPVGDLLHREVRRLQHHLDLEHHGPVDELLGRAVRDVAHDGRQIACRDAEPVGIEGHLALAGAMFVHQRHKAVEKVRLPRRRLGDAPLLRIETLHLVVELQQHVLQPVADDRIAEHVVAVPVGVGRHLEPDRDALDDPRRRIGDGVHAQLAEKRRIEPEGRFGEQIPRKGAEGGPEILRAVIERQHPARQQHEERVAAHLALNLIHARLGMAVSAKEQRTALAAAGVIAEKGEIGLADDELLLRGRDDRIQL